MIIAAAVTIRHLRCRVFCHAYFRHAATLFITLMPPVITIRADVTPLLPLADDDFRRRIYADVSD